MRANHSGLLHADSVKVPARDRLGREGRGKEVLLDGGSPSYLLGLGAVWHGLARGALEEMTGYTTRTVHRDLEKRLADYQVLTLELGRAQVLVESLCPWQDVLAADPQTRACAAGRESRTWAQAPVNERPSRPAPRTRRALPPHRVPCYMTSAGDTMPAKSSLAQIAAEIGLEEARRGVFETNNDNRGPRIDEYSIAANQAIGQAWCVKFAWWCYEQAATRLRIPNPFPRIFGAAQLEAWGKREGNMVPTPDVGDILIKESRHGGIATGPASANGNFPSVEGNTYAQPYEKRREGVYVLNSTKVSRCTFIRLAP